MLWNKKNKKKDKKNKMNIRISVIPDIFYGGKDPLIYHEQDKRALEKTTKKKVKYTNKVKLPISRKKIIIVLAILLVLVIGSASFYYLRQASPDRDGSVPKVKEQEKIVKDEVKPPPVIKEEPVIEEPVVEEDPAVVPNEPVVAENTITFPSILLRDSMDIDADSLTDEEEEIFKTDSGIWDSDKDGYYDGQEVFNLYNPTGFAPVKIVDSGLVKEYVNPEWQYRVYYPAVWEASGVDNQNNHVIFSSISGDFIEVRSFSKLPSENFATWFSKYIEGQSFSDLSIFNNKFKINGYQRKDSLTAYFVTDNAVFIMVYQASGNATDIPYRHVMQMMYQSFRTSAVFSDLPSQTPLPRAL